ncbi:MAG: hypothetical protein QGF46_03925 [Planctomycetota bacterium]|nr:hypothetical protein [Planctomycetota bacterium]
MKLIHKKSNHKRRGTVLLLVIVVSGLLAALATSFADSMGNQIDTQRDEGQALRAQLAAESGWEFAQRQLLLDPNWSGTSSTVTLLDGMTQFDINTAIDTSGTYTETAHNLSIDGSYGIGQAQLGGTVQVTAGDGGTSEIGLIFLGENLKLIQTNVMCDMLVTDLANKVEDWLFDANGDGYYQLGGANVDGQTKFNNSIVDGLLFRYKTSTNYQSLGEEVLISEIAQAPAWDFTGLTTPGPGKMIINYSSEISEVYTDDTVIIVAADGQDIDISDCHFGGGLIVICPTGYDLREESRNTLDLNNDVILGGGTNGFENNIGLIAPGCEIQSKVDGIVVNGFSIFNQCRNVRDSQFTGQTVIVKDCKKILKTDFFYDADVANNLPSFISFGLPGGFTQNLTMFEDFN